mmetsp:Transcript_18530/g.58048  ORF Transcript_18530/g.58048 Transcript_18530/m.58048 type:complete len:480 (+) Transcript_18530:3-1442(+)
MAAHAWGSERTARKGPAPCSPGMRCHPTASALRWAQRRIGTRWATQCGRPLGFSRFEYGLEWYKSKDDLMRSSPGKVLVGTSYEYQAATPTVRQVRKYASFHSHEEYWSTIEKHDKNGMLQNLHEVFPMEASRCLYFDVDGPPGFRELHAHVIPWLQHYVRWVFSGDRLGWGQGDPEPVVLRSSDQSKYSCHVVFPQIQFDGYFVQEQYMRVILDGLPAFVVDLEGGESVEVLSKLVDRVPYSRFQLFRGPYACKLAAGQLRRETSLEPESWFRGDPLTCFAGHVEPYYALDLPNVQRILEWNPELRDLHMTHQRHVGDAAVEGPRQISPQDLASLYMESFRQRAVGGFIDFAGMTDLEQYEAALEWLHPDRASQWWSWFRISGVTCSMLERYEDNRAAQDRILRAHMRWASAYPTFSEEENLDMIRNSAGRRVSRLHLLLNLVRFDNPGMQVRTSTWQWCGRTAGAAGSTEAHVRSRA